MKSLFYIIFFLFLCFNSNAQSGTRGAQQLSSSESSETKNIHAILVGVSDYKFIPSLKYADEDAKMFYDFLLNIPNVDPNNIQLFTDEEVTREGVLTALSVKSKSLTSNDMLIVYFAGHGDKHTEDDQTFLLLSNVDESAEYRIANAININDVYYYSKRASKNGASVLLAIDACRSGGFFDNLNQNIKNSVFSEVYNTVENIMAFTACTSGQSSMEYADLGGGHGAFTFYFINGLKGMADEGISKDGFVNHMELTNFVTPMVHRKTGNQQTPKSFADNTMVNILPVYNTLKEEAFASLKNVNTEPDLAMRGNRRGVVKYDPVSRKNNFLIEHYKKLVKYGQLIRPENSDEVIQNKEFWGDGNTVFSIKEPVIKRPYNENAFAIKYSPDASRIAIAGKSPVVKILDAKSLNVLQTYPHEGIRCVDFSPDGRYLVTASWFQELKVWDTYTNKLVKTLKDPKDDTRAICFSPSGKYLAIGGDDQVLRLWDTTNWELYKTFPKQHKNIIYTVSYLNDDNSLVSSDGDGNIYVWDVVSDKIVQRISARSEVRALMVAHDKIIFANGKSQIAVWDLKKRKVIDEYNLNVNAIHSIESDFLGNYLFVAGDMHKIFTINRQEKRVTHVFSTPSSITKLRIDPAYENLAGVSFEGHIVSSKIEIPTERMVLPQYAYNCLQDLMAIEDLKNRHEELKSYLGTALLTYCRETVTPFVYGESVIPDKKQRDKAKHYSDLFIELYQNNEKLSQDAETYRSLIEVYEIILNNDVSNINAAIKKLDAINSYIPQAGFTYNTQTILYQKLNELQKAQESAMVAIERIPKWIEPKSNLGKTYFMNHDYKAAIDQFTEIIEQRPDLPVGYFNLANVYAFLKEYSLAKKYYDKALDLSDTKVYIKCQYAKMLIEERAFEKAKLVLDECWKLDPDSYLPYYLKGEIYYQLMIEKEDETFLYKAEENYQKAEELNSSEPLVHVGLAKLYFDAYNIKSLRGHHENQFYKTKVNKIITQRCNSAIQLNPFLWEAYYYRALNAGLIHIKKSARDKAENNVIASIDKLVQQYPNIPESYYYAAKMHFALDDEKTAIKYLNQAMTIDDLHAPSYQALFSLYQNSETPEKANDLSQEIASRFSEPENFATDAIWVRPVTFESDLRSNKRKR